MSAMPESSHARSAQRGWLPVGLVAAAVLLLAIFQTVGLVRAHSELVRVQTSQQATVDQAQKLRTQLQAIATHTAQLADNGDAAARDVLDFMHRQGVTVSLPKKK